MLQMIKHALFAGTLSAVGVAIFYLLLSPAVRREFGYRPGIAAVIIPLVAFMAPHLAVLQVLMLLLVPALARTRDDILPIFIVGLIMMPMLGKPIIIGSLYLFPLSTVLMLSLGAIATMWMKPGRSSPHRIWTDIPFWIVFLLLFFIAARDQSATSVMRQFLIVGFAVIPPYYLVSRLVRSVEDARRPMLGLVLVGSICSVILAFEAVRFWPMYVELVTRFDVEGAVASHVSMRAGLLRASGPMLQSTAMAFVMSLCLLSGYALRRAFPTKFHWFAMLAVLAVGMIAPQSRNAWLGVATGLVMVEMFRGHVMRMGAVLAFFGALGGIVYVAVADNDRVAESVGASGTATGTAEYRQQLLRRGLEEYHKAPLLGAPAEVVNSRLQDLVQGEGIIDYVNTYLYLALFSGAVGLGAFLLALVIELATLGLQRPRWRKFPAELDIAAYAFGSIVMVAQMLIFTSFGDKAVTLYLMSFAIAAGLISGRRKGGGVASVSPKRIVHPGMVVAGNLPSLQQADGEDGHRQPA
ncbi:hypothetical protein ACFB49_20070 [Sphingomonas sp. DBB INV C78]|uniref:O-antigen ligase family protein n=1 Tax=Sphingomonas sp. DBB INV C78 TaxID=3349434 RepID=UPI0036D21D56